MEESGDGLQIGGVFSLQTEQAASQRYVQSLQPFSELLPRTRVTAAPLSVYIIRLPVSACTLKGEFKCTDSGSTGGVSRPSA